LQAQARACLCGGLWPEGSRDHNQHSKDHSLQRAHTAHGIPARRETTTALTSAIASRRTISLRAQRRKRRHVGAFRSPVGTQ
jgi:hypothetical protein